MPPSDPLLRARGDDPPGPQRLTRPADGIGEDRMQRRRGLPYVPEMTDAE